MIRDLNNVIDLLCKGLQSVPQDEAKFAQVYGFGLLMLVVACEKLNNEQPSSKELERMISSISLTLSSLPLGNAEIDRLQDKLIRAHMQRYFKGLTT
jgi:hypothetical protein